MTERKIYDITDSCVRARIKDKINSVTNVIKSIKESETITPEEISIMVDACEILLKRLAMYESLSEKKLLVSIGTNPSGTLYHLTKTGIEEVRIVDCYTTTKFTATRRDGSELYFRPSSVGYSFFEDPKEAERKLPAWLSKQNKKTIKK